MTVLHLDSPSSIGSAVPWFRARLSQLSRDDIASTALASELDLLENYRAAALRGEMIKYSNAHALVDHQLRIRGTDLMTKALHRAEQFGWTDWRVRVPLLTSGVPNLVAPSRQSTERNKTWETVLAAMCAAFCDATEFDEPDVKARFQGRSIGIAAKVLYSSNPAQQLSRIVEGADQGETSGAPETYVVCNITEVIPHARLFELMHKAQVHSADAIKNVVDGWLGAFQCQHNEKQWAARLKRRTALQAVLFFAPLVVPTADLPAGFIYTAIAAGRDSRSQEFEVALHRACQSALRYAPA